MCACSMPPTSQLSGNIDLRGSHNHRRHQVSLIFSPHSATSYTPYLPLLCLSSHGSLVLAQIPHVTVPYSTPGLHGRFALLPSRRLSHVPNWAVFQPTFKLGYSGIRESVCFYPQQCKTIEHSEQFWTQPSRCHSDTYIMMCQYLSRRGLIHCTTAIAFNPYFFFRSKRRLDLE
jgi:hypothetical protein